MQRKAHGWHNAYFRHLYRSAAWVEMGMRVEGEGR
jgi:hypothetical protein